ncbi:MAG TPA: cell wall hydrolase [Ancylobacter sp.]
MRVSDRYRRLGVVGAALVATLIGSSTDIGHQDLTGLLAHQPGIAERARLAVLNGSFHTLKAAAIAWPTSSSLIPGSTIAAPPHAMMLAIDVNRAAKADRLTVARADMPETDPEIDPAAGAGVSTGISMAGTATTPTETGSGTGTGPAGGAGIGTDPYEVADSPDDQPDLDGPDMATLGREGIYSVSAGDPTGDPAQLEAALALSADIDGDGVDISGSGDAVAWSLDEALQGTPSDGPIYQQAAFIFGFDNDALPPQPFLHRENVPANGGTTVAAKSGDAGDLDDGIIVRRGPSPAERLGLEGKRRDRAQKCLAEAVYFESRGEPERGQIGVAQVVMNRVFSGYYPADICRAVYQNANRKLACQFTFACDNIRDVVTEPRLWAQAKRIAADVLDGQLWDVKVGRATHYHARSVRPYWIREMRKLDRIGEHTFYRPRRWTS